MQNVRGGGRKILGFGESASPLWGLLVLVILTILKLRIKCRAAQKLAQSFAVSPAAAAGACD